MRIQVDEALCDLHGQCVFAAPDLFRFDERGELEYVQTVDEEQVRKARAAAAVCPAAAIEVPP